MNDLTVVDVKVLLPRLVVLQQRTDSFVSLTINLDLHRNTPPEVVYTLWVGGLNQNFAGDTAENAVCQAEAVLKGKESGPSSAIPDAIIVP